MVGLRIFVDMDDVLCDFREAAADSHSLSIEEMIIKFGVWHEGEEFWAPILSKGADFWRDIKPTPWYRDVLDEADSHSNGDFFLLSCPQLDPNCHLGKVQWVKRYLGEDFDRFLLTPYKELLAKPNTILIDDNPTNTTKFAQSGGTSFLFPSPSNCLRAFARDPMPGLIDFLERKREETDRI